MSDPANLRNALQSVQDAFAHANGVPAFEPGLNASPDAGEGEVAIQKACRLLDLNEEIVTGAYYGAIVEHSFIAIEHTLQGYLLELTGVEGHELRNHTTPYTAARGRVPVSKPLLSDIHGLYDDRRTAHYYGTTVTTQEQAESLAAFARRFYETIVGHSTDLEDYCNCIE